MKMLLSVFLWAAFFVSDGKGQGIVGPIDPAARYNDYASGTIGLSALSSALITVNLIRLSGNDRHKYDAMFGIVIGGAQTAYGLINAGSSERNGSLLFSVNLSLGLAAMVTSVLRLARKTEVEESRLTFNVICLSSGPGRTPVPGLRLCSTLR